MIEAEIDNIKTFIRESNPKTVNNTVLIDFKKVMSYSIKLSESILDNFLRTKELFNVAYESVTDKKVSMKFINIPKSEFVDIWKIRSSDVNKFIGITGYIRKATEIFHIPIVITYECKSCGARIPVMQLEENITKPSKCQCGCKGFTECDRKLKDQQKVIIEEDILSIDPTQKPRRMMVLLEDDLCHEDIDKEIQPGRKVAITGILQEKSKDKKSLIQIKYLLGNHIKTVDDTINKVKLTKKDKEELLKQVSEKGFIKKVTEKIYGTIYGHDEIKDALLLQLLGGDHLYINDKLEERGNIHILLCSSPGTGKTKLAKCSLNYMPNSKFTSGTNSSGVGLIATVTKDEEMGGWSLESGILPMCEKSICVIDEMDKMSSEDMGKLNNAMADLCVDINKASIHACYSEDTEVLTEEGWKNYNDVKNLKIAQYNKKTMSLSFINHNGLYLYDYSGKMINFKSRRQDIMVTPNHRMYTKEYSSEEFKIMNAEDLKYCQFKFLNTCKNYNNKEIGDAILIKGKKYKQKRTNIRYIKYSKDVLIPLELWSEFIGYFLADGSIAKGRNQIQFTLGTKTKEEKIIKCIKKLIKITNSKYYEYDYRFKRIKIHDPRIYNFIVDNFYKDNKKDMKIFFIDYNKKCLMALYNAMMTCDGHKDVNYCSLNKSIADSFNILAFLIGKSSSVTSGFYKSGYSNKKKTHYIVNLSNKKNTTLRNSKNVSRVQYNGKVFCFSVPSGIMITRRNGKIAIQGNTINTDVTILATANPKDRVFDVYDKIWKQIDLPKDFLDRFDLIFPMEAIKTEEHQRKIAHVLFDKYKQANDTTKKIITNDSIMKYIAYARNCIKPVMSKVAQDKIEKLYINLIKPSGSDEQAYMSTRLLTNVIRLATAAAKSRLSNTINEEDAQRAMDLLIYSLKKQEIIEDSVNGLKININKIENIVPRKTRNKSHAVMKIIKEIKNQKTGLTKFEDMLSSYKLLTGEDEDSLTLVIEKLHLQGDIIEPKRGFYKALN